MRYAIFSDIHGNLQAWNAIRKDMAGLQADVLVCLGDVVGYGPRPEEVLSAIREVTPNFVLGNHDAAAVGLLDASLFNAHAESVIKWTSDQLSEGSKKFFLETPLAIEEEDLFFVHAELREPGLFGYIETADDAKTNFAAAEHFVTFIGHTHHPLVFDLGQDGQVHSLGDSDLNLEGDHRYIINVGSVGEPRNPDDIRARYVIYDSDTKQVYFRRVDFDPEAYRRDLAATSLQMTPYFLKVIDHQVALEAEAERALMMDMQAPASLPNYVAQSGPATLNRRLLMPNSGAVNARTKPKPIPNLRRPSPWPMVGMFTLCLLLLAIGYLLFLAPNASEPELKVAEKPAAPDKQSKTRLPKEEAKEPEVALVGEPEPEPDPNLAVATVDDPADPEPEPEPAAEPEPKPETRIVAYWRMEEEAPGNTLLDWTGSHSLKQLTPARSIAPLAPDPIPLSGEANAHSSTLATWAESSASGEFALTADRSFTFEGWLMTDDREKKPIFIAGTKNGESTGWRLHVVAAKSASARGSMRLQYKGSEVPIEILSNDIDLFDPVAHHFAVVWDHAHTAKSGKAQLYFDGKMVVERGIPYARISATEPPFKIGDSSNPDRVAIDELRFSAGALAPNDFLSRGRVPNSDAPPAFMIDVGKKSTLYAGANSPAHADGAIPKNHNTWILANSETDQELPIRTVSLASGKEYPIPVSIDLGAARSSRDDGKVAWDNAGGDSIRSGDRKGSLFGLDLMDSSQDPDGEKAVGIRVRGLEPGDYTVYFSPLVADELDEDIRFGLGVDLASDPKEADELSSNGMQEFRYEGGTAADKDERWELNRNYFTHDFTIADADDYLVAIVSSGEASTAIPFLQIVKHSQTSLDVSPPIAFNFDDQEVVNQASEPHPNIRQITALAPKGFVAGSSKIEPFEGSESTLRLNLGEPEVKDYVHFSFDVSGAKVSLAGFSLEHAGTSRVTCNVTLHSATGDQIGELVSNFRAPKELGWVGSGSLAGDSPLGIELEPGTYQVRINAVASKPDRRWNVDSVKVDFAR